MLMPSEDLRIILEDVKGKFDTVIEAVNIVGEKLDRHAEENRNEFDEVKKEILELSRDLNDHRQNTELHSVRRKPKGI
jgi:hypothetical protein